MLTIAEALRTFLADEHARVPEAVPGTELVLEDLVSFLEGYGYQYTGTGMPEEEWRADGPIGEISEPDEAFVATHAPDMIPTSLSEFLYYWYIRRSVGDAEDARVTGEVLARLMGWLGERGLADPEESRVAAATARLAAEELPRAKRLSDLLGDLAEASWVFPDVLADEEIDDFLAIVRVEPGRIWLERGVGPVEVSEEASRLAEIGWEVNLVARKRSGDWAIEEIGNVYPRSLGRPSGPTWK